METVAPWTAEGWTEQSSREIEAALARVGIALGGPVETVKSWGRSCVRRVETGAGRVWIKYGYGLPPGEERVLTPLARRWPQQVPRVVASWPGAVAIAELEGAEMPEDAALDDWLSVATMLAELAAGEREHLGDWLALGVRDRRPPQFGNDVRAMLAGPVVRELPAPIRADLDSFAPDWIERYDQAFTDNASLVHQDSGCCNVHLTPGGPVLFDWADVVIGHPVFSCDRLLDQAPRDSHDAIIAAFCDRLELPLAEFKAVRRSNVLHEALRYHDELAHLAPDDPAFHSLSGSVRSQLTVIVKHEAKRRTP